MINLKLKKVVITAQTLEAFKKEISKHDPEEVKLYIECCPEDLVGREFTFMNETFVIMGADVEDHEEPLLDALRKDCVMYSEDVTDEGECGYITLDEHPSGHFRSEFQSHTGWSISDGQRYAKGIPNIKDGTVVGFYWIPLSGIMDLLSEQGSSHEGEKTNMEIENDDEEWPEFNAVQMLRLTESDKYLKRVYEDLTSKGHSSQEALEALFWSNVYEDSVFSAEYSKFAN